MAYTLTVSTELYNRWTTLQACQTSDHTMYYPLKRCDVLFSKAVHYQGLVGCHTVPILRVKGRHYGNHESSKLIVISKMSETKEDIGKIIAKVKS